MAYIGKTPVIGNFQKCDSIAVVNGQAAYTLQVGGTNVSPQSENHMLVSLNGILQAPVDSFTVSGSTLTFASNLVTGDVIDFVMILGNVLDLGVPSDNTVSLAKLTATGTKDATTFLRGDNTFAEAGGGSLVKIATQTFSNVASYTDTTSITSTYNNYLIILENVLPATNNVDLEINWKNSGGSNLNKTAINRKIASCDSGGTADSLNTGGNSDLHNETTNHQIGEDMGNDATLDGGASVNIILYNANSSTSSKFYEHNTHMGHSGDCYYSHSGGGKIKSNDQVRQFYIAFNSGNITSGKYTIYGFEV
jgi:hypothetical protein